jgi:hypothetical protein
VPRVDSTCPFCVASEGLLRLSVELLILHLLEHEAPEGDLTDVL